MKKLNKQIQILLALALLITLIGPAVLPARSVASDRGNIHPILVDMAVETPDQMVSVIIQTADQADRTGQFVERLGGTITQDLHIINAFAAVLPAESVPELAGLPGVNWVSFDAVVENAKKKVNDDDNADSLPANHFLDTLGVRQVWEMGYQGEGITVAVIDSGVFTDRDFTVKPKMPQMRILVEKSFNPNAFKTDDSTGHGTHVAGIIGGHGGASNGIYSGIAPKVNLLNLKVSDENGMATASDVVAALQWVYDNKELYNIRVVNISLNSTVEGSYHLSPMNAAAEILWFNGIVVVASAGNSGALDEKKKDYNTVNSAPANDPFIITVGASDEQSTPDPSDDSMATFSAYEMDDDDGYIKPDIIAPCTDIVSVMSWSSDWFSEHPDRVVLDGEYFRLSVTSMAAPMVTGAVALLLQAEPGLTPDQVKYRLLEASGELDDSDYPYLNVYEAITTPTTESANIGFEASKLLWTGDEPVMWDSVNWNSVNWNSVNWNSVNWNSVNWNSVNWNSVNWNN